MKSYAMSLRAHNLVRTFSFLLSSENKKGSSLDAEGDDEVRGKNYLHSSSKEIKHNVGWNFAVEM